MVRFSRIAPELPIRNLEFRSCLALLSDFWAVLACTPRRVNNLNIS